MKDQLGNEIFLPTPPQRIVSLVPSQTELLFDLGLETQIVGITKFCIYPAEKVRFKTKVGGTKDFSIETIKALQPDLIIANKEENDRSRIEALQREFVVWVSDISTLDDAYEMIHLLGEMTGKPKQSQGIVKNCQEGFGMLEASISSQMKVAYLIWQRPYMVAASSTFINDMLQRCGFQNVFAHLRRYPEVSVQDIITAQPDVIFLSSEPYPFKEKHLETFSSLFPFAKVMLVDGEMFSWYGSRLKWAAAYFHKLRHRIIHS